MENNGYIYENKPAAERESAAPDYETPEAENMPRENTEQQGHDFELFSKPVVHKINRQPETKTEPKSYRFSLPARVGMWTVGVIAGLTVIFGCFVIWVLGLDYLGVINRDKQPEKNGVYNFYIYGENEAVPQTPSAGDSYDDFENFLDDFFGSGGANGFFGDFFAGGDQSGEQFGSGAEGSAQADPQVGSPGLGIKAVELALDFAIEDKYTAGVVIDTIEEYSSFIGTDVKENDLIVAAEGKTISTVAELKASYADKAVGDELDLTIARYSNGVASTFEVTVKLIAMQ